MPFDKIFRAKRLEQFVALKLEKMQIQQRLDKNRGKQGEVRNVLSFKSSFQKRNAGGLILEDDNEYLVIYALQNITIIAIRNHSFLSELTGLANAAFNDWKLIVTGCATLF